MTENLPQQCLNKLLGLPLIISRNYCMLVLHFGEMRDRKTRTGETTFVGEWALHVQAPWRVVSGTEILFGHEDMFYEPDAFRPFDEETISIGAKLDAFNDRLELRAPKVTEVSAERFGGLKLILEDDLVLEVFSVSSSDLPDFELWRLFQPSLETPHYVMEAVGFLDAK